MDTTRLLPALRVDPAADGTPDRLYEAFTAYSERLGGSHVVLTTPTGSGKSLVATAAIHAALSTDRVSFYTAPVKALVSEKLFDLVATFGADNVGMLTGDAAVNAGAAWPAGSARASLMKPSRDSPTRVAVEIPGQDRSSGNLS